MKLRTGDAWMPAPDYGRSLTSLTLNLLVRDIEPALAFQQLGLEASLVYADPGIAGLQGFGAQWMLHADRTCGNHPLDDAVAGTARRGAGVEIRLHGSLTALRAMAATDGFSVVSGTTGRPHGLREACLMDQDGCIWVPDTPVCSG